MSEARPSAEPPVLGAAFAAVHLQASSLKLPETAALCEMQPVIDAAQLKIHSETERIMERISMRGTNLEISSSFDLIITTSIVQSDNESMSVSANRNAQQEPVETFVCSLCCPISRSSSEIFIKFRYFCKLCCS